MITHFRSREGCADWSTICIGLIPCIMQSSNLAASRAFCAASKHVCKGVQNLQLSACAAHWLCDSVVWCNMSAGFCRIHCFEIVTNTSAAEVLLNYVFCRVTEQIDTRRHSAQSGRSEAECTPDQDDCCWALCMPVVGCVGSLGFYIARSHSCRAWGDWLRNGDKLVATCGWGQGSWD